MVVTDEALEAGYRPGLCEGIVMSNVIVLNFSYPLVPEQLRKIEELAVVDIDAQIDPQQPLVPQLSALVDSAGRNPSDWQTVVIIVNPPSLNFSTAVLLAELHGRCGYFPPIIRLRPVAGSIVPRFEVAEVVNLQAVREKARRKRSGRTRSVKPF